MSVETTRGGMHVVRCDDNPACGERFTSACAKSALRKQLEHARWEVTVCRFLPGGLKTVCEWHKPKPTRVVIPDQYRY